MNDSSKKKEKKKKERKEGRERERERERERDMKMMNNTKHISRCGSNDPIPFGLEYLNWISELKDEFMFLCLFFFVSWRFCEVQAMKFTNWLITNDKRQLNRTESGGMMDE